MFLFFVIQLLLTLSLLILFILVFWWTETLGFGLIPSIILSIFATYFLSLFLLTIVNKIARILMTTKEGEIEGVNLVLWTIQETTLDIAYTLSKKLFIHSPFPDWLFILFGFKRRKGVSILTRIWDPDLIEVGENTMIGPDTIVSAHHIRRGKLYRRRIIIGRNVTIGAKSLIGPGVRIGKNTMVTYGSSVPPNWVLDDNSLYGGVPVKKLKSLESASSDQ